MYDDELDNDWLSSELSSIPATIKKLEGTYCKCHMIALNHQQTAAAEKVLEAGYELIGHFASAHNDGKQVLLFAKGLTVYHPEPTAPKIKKTRKPSPLKFKPRRKK